MIIDCGTCPAAGRGCAECVVRVLLETPVTGLPLDAVERAAVDAVVGAGLIGVRQAAELRAQVEPWDLRVAG